MYHPFPPSSSGPQTIPAFLERSRLSLDEIKKNPFKLTRHRSRVKPPRKEERIDSAKVVSLDISNCRLLQDTFKKICAELNWKIWLSRRQLGRCDIYWQAHQAEDFQQFYEGGSVNKFPNMANILKKINLTQALCNLKMIFPDEYDFYPKTWFLPFQFHEFCAEVAFDKRKKKKKHAPTFIVKPDGGTQGDGIYLIKDPRDYQIKSGSATFVVQQYVSKPFLLDKLKFDLRIYAVVLSIDPIQIYLSREGLARFCTIPYKEPSNKNIGDSYMHLTNYSLNKYSDRYIHTDRLTDGSKRTITSVLARLSKLGYDTCELWADIEQVVVKTILAVAPELQVAHKLTMKKGSKVKCFQLLGFDILLKDDLKPVLLEVNANPSLYMMYEKEVAPGVYEEVPSAVDKHVKYKLIKETLLLVAPKQKLQQSKKPEESIPEEFLALYQSLLAEESDPENFLYEVFPGNYKPVFSRLQILERLSSLYQSSLGIHESLMSANSFRLFARKTCLVHQSTTLNIAAIDILYIEIQRRWSEMQPEVAGGLTFQAFLEAFMIMANRSKLKSENRYEMVDNLLHYCEANLEISNRTPLRRAKLPKIPVRQTKRVSESTNYGTENVNALNDTHIIDIG